jgi:hypothetical protein
MNDPLMRRKKQLIEKVIEILSDESDNFKYRRIAAKDCAQRLLAILEYEEEHGNKTDTENS